MKFSGSRSVYVLLFAYIAISLTYQIVGSVSLIIGYFDLRHQMRETIQIDFEQPMISSVMEPARRTGLRAGDMIESLNGAPYTGRAQWHRARWYARAGDLIQVGVRRKDGTHATSRIPLTGFTHSALANRAVSRLHVGETIFVLFLQIVVPLFCLVLGYWVALARPRDPNAWFILIVLSFPQAFISVSTYNWLPGIWLALRLWWHLMLEVLAPVALLWLGLLFPERSRLDVRLPWLKWLVLAIAVCALSVGLAADYDAWYDLGLIPNLEAIDRLNDRVLSWVMTFCIVVYWVAIFDKLRTASSPDARRRIQVLCAGSVVGLGSLLIIWGVLPWFGIADPGGIEWLGYLSAILMLAFPLSLAYVVIVQRAMDVRILLRMGTKYALARTTLAIVQRGAVALILIYIVIPFLTGERQEPPRMIFLALGIAGVVGLSFGRPRLSNQLAGWLDRKFFREAYDAELILSELAEEARKFHEPRTLIDRVSRRISEVLHVQQVAVLLRIGETFYFEQTLGLTLNGGAPLPAGSATIQELTRTGRPSVLSGQKADGGPEETSEQERHFLEATRAEVILPLPGREKLLGLMTLGPKQSEEAYSPSDLRLLGSVGTQTGLGLEIADLANSLAQETAQRAVIDRELEIAREVQQRLFPQRIPAIQGVGLAGYCRPAQGVGGDYYDVIELDGGRLGLAIGDVSGKGIPAALLMASLRACLRTMTLVGGMNLAKLMQRMNQLVYESSGVNRYATFFFAIYDPSTRNLQYVNAGHNAPCLLRAGAGTTAPVRLEAGGIVVGLLPNTVYEEQSLVLETDDLLLAYTDGISEAMNDDEEEWGEGRMMQAAEAVRGLPPEEILRSVFVSADEFKGNAPQHDDMTLLVLKVG